MKSAYITVIGSLPIRFDIEQARALGPVIASANSNKSITFDYATVRAGKACRNNWSLENLCWLNHRWLQGACGSSIIKQGLPDCLVGAEKINASIPLKDTDTLELFVRAVVCKILCHGHHGPVWSPGLFQHLAQ